MAELTSKLLLLIISNKLNCTVAYTLDQVTSGKQALVHVLQALL